MYNVSETKYSQISLAYSSWQLAANINMILTNYPNKLPQTKVMGILEKQLRSSASINGSISFNDTPMN